MMTLRAVAVTAFALTASALSVATPPMPAEATVQSVIVRPDSQRVDVVVGVRGDAPVKDFVLSNPDRIVLDLSNATLGLKAQSYDRAARGGIVDVRYGQNKPGVVRVVVTLDASHPYKLTRGANEVRISVMGSTSTLPAWVAGYQAAREASRASTTMLDKQQLAPVAKTYVPAMKVNGFNFTEVTKF